MVSHVVDGEDYGNSVKQRVVRILRAQEDRHKRRLPVVAMHHVGRPNVLGNLHRGPAEFAEAFGVVRIIFALLCVELFAVEIGRVVHKVIAHAGKKSAVGLYSDPKTWQRIQLNGMAKDFSWNASAAEYAGLYETARKGRIARASGTSN